MPGDIDLSGFVFTRDEWLQLDEEDRSELLELAEIPFLSADEVELLAPSDA
ncbi:MAG: hypothetical protein KJO07_02520 [Deltaproteobacteria bacterium]|nr:hypothetical protein [Deltaproteobacteria bacterium]